MCAQRELQVHFQFTSAIAPSTALETDQNTTELPLPMHSLGTHHKSCNACNDFNYFWIFTSNRLLLLIQPPRYLIQVELSFQYPWDFSSYPIPSVIHPDFLDFFPHSAVKFDFNICIDVTLDNRYISAPQGSTGHYWSGNEVFLSPCGCF